MTHDEFNHILDRINMLSTEQMRQLRSELDGKIAAEKSPASGHSQGSIGAMRDAADELDEAVEHAMNLRQRPWRLSPGE